ncbi:UDP-N-acetylmuramoylalanyl-D-glutamate--2,6-diaminopimelate ligase [Wolbachia pipientis]|uniref:UDP-N-acetylmuramoyl-tripeptide--D-alanyl-D-alanine ligase n=1 Tax=Wolbachia pipientis TaxID=955 RepID=A0A1E7QJ62_WOLPI|nr:UDP-N-acetylmuramoyl-tripeptide--D-alanyl-D-alanine ligase [Wolbachia pipientis]OEY86508.1 UDP-N-acetylmuramoylalanyl-D-glutamate--2,6-diaminopimelate ligase [Wolbachia pipientis]
MFQWNETHLYNATNGKTIGSWSSSSVSTDTRNIKRGDLFIAIKGTNFDGHDFVHEAFAKGAAAAVVSRENIKVFPMVVVTDTLKALHNMASYYIKHLQAIVIAITGSVGKTTTKDMLYTVLSKCGISYANIGNFNNHIGLPLTILSTPANCEYLILEMGTSNKGEIAKLSKISNPNIAVITNIGYAHIANFPDVYALAQAKLEILHGIASNGILLLNHDDRYYDYLLLHAHQTINKIVSFGTHPNATVRLLNLTKNYAGLNLEVKLNDNNIINFDLPIRREQFIHSALAVAAVIQSLKLDLPKNAFDTFKIRQGRGDVHSIQYNGKHIYLIDDSYNASPTSMKAAIEDLGGYFHNRKIALLGDMLELGNHGIKFHRALLDHIIDQKIDKVYTVGKIMIELYKLLPDKIRGMHFTDANQLKTQLNNIINNNDTVLVKGSQLMNMDMIIEEFLRL